MSHHCVSPAFSSAGLLGVSLLLLSVFAAERGWGCVRTTLDSQRCELCKGLGTLSTNPGSNHFSCYIERCPSNRFSFPHSCMATAITMTSASHRWDRSYQLEKQLPARRTERPQPCILLPVAPRSPVCRGDYRGTKAPSFPTLPDRMLLR